MRLYNRTLVNGHFKAVFSNPPIKQKDLNSNIQRMNDVTFEYFSTTCGEEDRGGDINLYKKYNSCTARDLKRKLRKFKLKDGDIRVITFASRILRNLLANKTNTISLNHDSYIKHNFWEYFKNAITYESSVLPSFSKTKCVSFFMTHFSATSQTNRFTIPSWIPSLAISQVPFLLDQPYYQQITELIP